MLEGIVTWAEIDLDAIAFNVRAFKRHVGQMVQVIAVVKANAYGHGAGQVARAALDAGATLLAVHRATEGVELRQAGITAPILVMGYTPPSGAEMIVKGKLTPTVITLECAQALHARADALGAQIPVHIKVDTGMNRFGLMPDQVLPFLDAIRGLSALRLEGLFTHLATADSADSTYVRQQLALFNDVRAAVTHAGFDIPLVHAANSAAAMKLPEAHFNAIRPGISLYGMAPSDEWPPVFEIRPALTLKSRVSRVQTLPAGAAISYGRTFITQRPTLAALVPVGYGDGFHRILSNKGSVLIRGQRAPILGRICMDQFVVDAGRIPDVQLDEEVVIVGRQDDAQITAEEVARLAGTINYEVTTSLVPRVVRVFMRAGQVVGTTGPGLSP